MGIRQLSVTRRCRQWWETSHQRQKRTRVQSPQRTFTELDDLAEKVKPHAQALTSKANRDRDPAAE